MHYGEPLSPSSAAHLSHTTSFGSRRTTGGESSYSYRGRALTEAEEAELLSQATSQAMIAARSILLAGGSQATALSTAKAAAHSILVPNTHEMDGPALGKVFLSRRKAKRQAEVVASMALLSVKQTTLIPSQGANAAASMEKREADSFMGAHRTSAAGTTPRAAPVPVEAPFRRFQSHSTVQSAVSTTGSTASTTRPFRRGVDALMRKKRNQLPPIPKRRAPVPIQMEALSPPVSPARSHLPVDLPKSRPKTKNLVASSDQDPIYHRANVDQRPFSFQSRSVSSEDSRDQSYDESYTYGSETYEQTTIPPLDEDMLRGVGSQNDFLNNNVDPFLTTLTNVFFCGPFETPPPPRRGNRTESRNDDQDIDASDSEDRERPPRSRERVPLDSKSTADSSQLLKELNLSSDEEDTPPKSASLKSSIRQSMEDVVLRALSTTPPLREKQQPTTNYKDRITITVQENPKDAVSTTSSLTATHRTRLQALSQRVKFRRWMRKRRASDDTYGYNE